MVNLTLNKLTLVLYSAASKCWKIADIGLTALNSAMVDHAPDSVAPRSSNGDVSADIWSVGNILYLLCTGQTLPAIEDAEVPNISFTEDFDMFSQTLFFDLICQMWLAIKPSAQELLDQMLDRLCERLPTIPKYFHWEELFPDQNEAPTVKLKRYERAHGKLDDRYGEHRRIVSLTRLGFAYLLLGKATAAEDQFSKALRIQRRLEAEGRVEWGMTKYGLGRAYFDQGKVDEALQQFTECEAQLSEKGEMDANVLLCNFAVAQVNAKLGNTRLAVELGERTLGLQSQSQALGPDHRDTLTTEHELVWIRHECGESPGSQKILEDVLERRQRTLGSEHPDTLQSLAGLGWYFYYQNQYDEAVVQFQRSFDGRRPVLGPEHPKTATSANGLAWACNDMKKPDVAKFEKALAALEVAFGRTDSRVKEVKLRLKKLRARRRKVVR
jgi:tetratricopeptide (TPR) repeat protein